MNIINIVNNTRVDIKKIIKMINKLIEIDETLDLKSEHTFELGIFAQTGIKIKRIKKEKRKNYQSIIEHNFEINYATITAGGESNEKY